MFTNLCMVAYNVTVVVRGIGSACGSVVVAVRGQGRSSGYEDVGVRMRIADPSAPNKGLV